ncbi:precorrin-6A/cobalt-precorrin-6A reductase, partial [Nocardia tengchongensis]|uniref:precorrin-6A/cobalt-precorrin-6A reductase n=1 Tax=Nocardia tengchongensis TaxID=2055889 RepID=UPI0036A87F40
GLARANFRLEQVRALLMQRPIDVLVTKDSGGALTEAKLSAARELGLAVVMIDRPPLPAGAEQVETVAAAWDWLRAQRDSVM